MKDHKPQPPPEETEANDPVEQEIKQLEHMTEEELLKKAKEYKDLSQRLAADYQNLQRDTDRRIGDMRKYATEQLLLEIAPLIDYFDSAFAAVPAEEQNSNWMVGMQHIRNHFIKVLQDHGVEVIEAVGKDFDPHQHEAVGEEEQANVTSGQVLKQVQAGLTLNGKVFRHAKVVVAK